MKIFNKKLDFCSDFRALLFCQIERKTNREALAFFMFLNERLRGCSLNVPIFKQFCGTPSDAA